MLEFSRREQFAHGLPSAYLIQQWLHPFGQKTATQGSSNLLCVWWDEWLLEHSSKRAEMTVAYSQDQLNYPCANNFQCIPIPVCHYPPAQRSFLGQFSPLLLGHTGNSQLSQHKPRQPIIRCVCRNKAQFKLLNASQGQESITADDIRLWLPSTGMEKWKRHFIFIPHCVWMEIGRWSTGFSHLPFPL